MLDDKALANKSEWYFKEFLTSNNKFKKLAFFRRTPGGALMIFKIMHYYFLNKDLHVEELVKQIPTSIVSRPSIFSYIDSAVEHSILVKGEGIDDKRTKTIKPSDSMIKEYKQWMLELGN
jgi:hypothetical protein